MAIIFLTNDKNIKRTKIQSSISGGVVTYNIIDAFEYDTISISAIAFHTNATYTITPSSSGFWSGTFTEASSATPRTRTADVGPAKNPGDIMFTENMSIVGVRGADPVGPSNVTLIITITAAVGDLDPVEYTTTEVLTIPV